MLMWYLLLREELKLILHTGLCLYLQILTSCTAWPVFLLSPQQIALNCNHHRQLSPVYKDPKQDIGNMFFLYF